MEYQREPVRYAKGKREELLRVLIWVQNVLREALSLFLSTRTKSMLFTIT
jgi:hypothetical protein